MTSLRLRPYVKIRNFATRIFVRSLLAGALALCISACSSSGEWRDYNYGPADWLAEREYGEWNTMYSYEKFLNPKIEIHYVDNLTEFCGNNVVLGCARFGHDTCLVWVGKNAALGTINHEKRHCYGWRHPQNETALSYNRTSKNRPRNDITIWIPMDQFL